MIPTILFCVLVLCIWIHYENKKSSNAGKKESESFWNKEHEADFVRKKDISSLEYITIPMEELPFGILEQIPEKISAESSLAISEKETSISLEDADTEKMAASIKTCEQTVRDLSQKRILNLTGITNTELKLTYGAGNLEELSGYDQNFTLLARTLHQWGSALNALGFQKEAQTVLEFGIGCGSDISGSYALLARFYREQNDAAALDRLLAKAEALNTLTKAATIEKIQTERNYCLPGTKGQIQDDIINP